MQKFTYKLAGILSLQGIVLAGFLSPYFFNYKQAVTDGFMAASNDKHALLAKQSQQPRVIFLGGSAFAFGNDSPYIAKQLKNYYPINMGLHAGLGMQYMLNEVKQDLKPGDIVIISFEYENFIDFPPGAKDVFDIVESRWQNLQFVPINYAPALLDEGLIFTGGVLRRSVSSLTGAIERKSYYQRSSFNQSGDLIAHYDLPSFTEKVAQDNETFEFAPQNVERAIQYMNDFNAESEAKGVKVFFAYPPLMEKLLKKSQPEISKVEQELERSLNFPILDKPEEVAYPESYYFDTRYHLNKTGVQARSQHLAKKIADQLNQPSP